MASLPDVWPLSVTTVASLKGLVMGEFTPRKLANFIIRGYFPGSQWLNIVWDTLEDDVNSSQDLNSGAKKCQRLDPRLEVSPRRGNQQRRQRRCIEWGAKRIEEKCLEGMLDYPGLPLVLIRTRRSSEYSVIKKPVCKPCASESPRCCQNPLIHGLPARHTESEPLRIITWTKVW